MREMKESNIPWVGPIPKEWNVGRIKQGYDVTLGKMYAAKEQQKEDGTLENYLCAANIKWAGIDTSVHKQMYFTEKEKEQYLLNNGDAVVMEGGMAGTTCLYKGEYYPCYIQNSVHKISSKNNNSTSFFAYWMEVVCSSGYVENVCNKATIMHYTKDKVCNTPLLLIPVEEQNEIVGYLNEKCSVINSSISRHQQIIEKLEEYRKSVITQAVTKGLDPNAEMKDSGNHLLGNIPADWVMKRLRNVAAIVRGGSPRPIDQYITDGDGYNWIKIGDATGNGKYITSTKQKIIKESLSKTRIVNPGTLLLTNSMSFGHPYILQITGCIHDGWLAFSDYREMIPEYLYYYLMAEPTMVQFKSSVDGSVVQNLNIDKVKNAIIVCPSLTEQKAIVSYLDTVGGQVDESIKKHAEIIEKLKEYKQSIIYNAVTGKIDCRVTE